MSITGVILEWTVDEGWGVIESRPTPGGCWGNFSVLATASFWEPSVGEHVEFEFEVADQDGYKFRATRIWPLGSEPFEHDSEGPGPGYISEVIIDFD